MFWPLRLSSPVTDESLHMQQATPTPRVHRTAPAIAKRIGEILDEPDFPPERVYQWRDNGRIRCFSLGSHVCALDTDLVEDLTGARAA